ncbi:hypothetical protein SCLCIDRAFT_16412 [Scleroderma citrinum Foug A]|uniref:Protein kinase domain-containing protein n=1 Tax=Scleroderma citrinum Foug A TaxID=1036808 RepID=A0A0C3A5K3_9AGAM|nr:hypothetical protein SCLCIDRAFT_16412 [Scleroderma citrinum Foug A]
MDEIVDREMKGLTLEEDKLRVEPCGFTDLIRRIFPTLTTILPVDLNNAYCKISTSTQAPKAQSCQHRLTRLESRTLPKAAAQSRQAKKSDHSLASKAIYDVKSKKWKWQEIVPREISAHISDDHFVHPFADAGLVPQGRDESELGQAAQGADTDVEDVGSSGEGSSFLDGRPRKGAAYDGDSSKDEDYFSGKGMKKHGPLVENQFAGLLNAISASVSEHVGNSFGHNGKLTQAEVIHAFAYADKDLLGYDPTIDIHHPPSIPNRIYCHNFIGTIISGSDEIFNIFSLLSSSSGFIGRGTVCWHVRPVDAGPGEVNEGKIDSNDYVLKDNWVDEDLVDHEASILSHIAGIKGVPILVQSWTVQYKGEDDTTLRYRPAAWSPFEKFINRVHRRQLLRPVGSPLSSFRSQKELLLGLITRLEIHQSLIDLKNVLHGDISPDNLIFERAPNGVLCQLYLIDFDYAIHLKPGVVKYPKATGTLPFASLHILRQISDCNESMISHVAADDLESFFYVFMWLCVLHDSPNGSVRPWPEDDDFIVHAWGEGAMHPGGLIFAQNAKSHFIYSPNTIIDKQFTPYFDNLKPLAKEWKDLIKEEDQLVKAATML